MSLIPLNNFLSLLYVPVRNLDPSAKSSILLAIFITIFPPLARYEPGTNGINVAAISQIR